ncbi:uncharacterized protein [Hemitrygon akajei]|uniref:uncharacterized protein n=1 Tax=Hemitrygon akajei TaxID=2704970 RepID=UPI003BF9A2BC
MRARPRTTRQPEPVARTLHPLTAGPEQTGTRPEAHSAGSVLECAPLRPENSLCLYSFSRNAATICAVLKAATGQYRDKIQTQLSTNNTRSFWQGLHTIADFKAKHSGVSNIAASLPGGLNLFCAGFDVANTDPRRDLQMRPAAWSSLRQNYAGVSNEWTVTRLRDRTASQGGYSECAWHNWQCCYCCVLLPQNNKFHHICR